MSHFLSLELVFPTELHVTDEYFRTIRKLKIRYFSLFSHFLALVKGVIVALFFFFKTARLSNSMVVVGFRGLKANSGHDFRIHWISYYCK